MHAALSPRCSRAADSACSDCSAISPHSGLRLAQRRQHVGMSAIAGGIFAAIVAADLATHRAADDRVLHDRVET